MKYIKIVLAIIVVVSSALGVMDILDTYTVTPILFTSVAFFLLINGKEYYKSSKKIGAAAFIITAIFMILLAGFNLYTGLKI